MAVQPGSVPIDPTPMEGLCQWTTGDNLKFFPAAQTRPELTPGVYGLFPTERGICFEKIPVRTTGLLHFPQTNIAKVLDEIQKFWDREHIFKEYDLPHKRGVLLHGPPGSGKSCLIRLIMADLIDNRDGVIFHFDHPDIFSASMRMFRAIQPDTPIVVMMEDIDAIIRRYNESSVLQILDGIDRLEKCIYIATTNYPERLGPRIINRPSRFDKKFLIDHPNPESRRLFLEHIIKPQNISKLNIPLDKWVKDTDRFSLAHLQELFTAVVILGDPYDEALKLLSAMKEPTHSEDYDHRRGKMGFNGEPGRWASGGRPGEFVPREDYPPGDDEEQAPGGDYG